QMGSPEIYTFPTPNVALRGEAAQSSTLSFAAAFKAIDGRRNSFYTKGSCSHTAEGETSPWWRVDLLRTFIITSIKVTNRGDCCAERLDGAEIRIGKSLHNNGNDNPRCATISHIRPGKTLTIHCDNGMMEGRYVNMVIPGNGKTLTLCEVEVYATPKGIAITDWITHMISGDSAKAVDGCRLLNFVQNCCVHTLEHNNPWWFVDLVSVHKVSAVTIYNRQDCCAETLIGAEIRVGNKRYFHDHSNPRCDVISAVVVKKQSVTFQCPDMEGRYVSVVNPGTSKLIEMCEVEIYASPVGRSHVQMMDQMMFQD
uniref:Fucolectin tachylectin-4 pentraxin-1 domain-containing protein n=1 Tax=Sphaeramia orbicularis TaxID=375764 RepID=A0A673CGM3_9TELE